MPPLPPAPEKTQKSSSGKRRSCETRSETSLLSCHPSHPSRWPHQPPCPPGTGLEHSTKGLCTCCTLSPAPGSLNGWPVTSLRCPPKGHLTEAAFGLPGHTAMPRPPHMTPSFFPGFYCRLGGEHGLQSWACLVPASLPGVSAPWAFVLVTVVSPEPRTGPGTMCKSSTHIPEQK